MLSVASIFKAISFFAFHREGPTGSECFDQSPHRQHGPREAKANILPPSRAKYPFFSTSVLRPAVKSPFWPSGAQPAWSLTLRNKHPPGNKQSPSTQKCLSNSRTGSMGSKGLSTTMSKFGTRPDTGQTQGQRRVHSSG